MVISIPSSSPVPDRNKQTPHRGMHMHAHTLCHHWRERKKCIPGNNSVVRAQTAASANVTGNSIFKFKCRRNARLPKIGAWS